MNQRTAGCRARAWIAALALALAGGCAPRGAAPSQSTSPPPTEDAAPEFRIVFDNLSDFHLDGEFLEFDGDGKYTAQVLVHTETGVDELIYRGHAGGRGDALDQAFVDELRAGLDSIRFAGLRNPPGRTLLPDVYPARLTFERTHRGALRSKELSFVLEGTHQDRLAREVLGEPHRPP